MARIPENEVERLKREISVQRLAEARGIKLTRQGANLLGNSHRISPHIDAEHTRSLLNK